jgi:hypothetical protein
MNKRTKNLWLPAMATILGASFAMTCFNGWASVLVGCRRARWRYPYDWPWLAALPLFGALGAYLSRRAVGPVLSRSRLVAGLAAVLWLLLMSFSIEPVELAVNAFSQFLCYAYGVANWVAIPGFALLLGASPFLREWQVADLRTSDD